MAAQNRPEDFSVFPPLLQHVAAQGVLKRYPRGVILMHEGEPGGSLFFVLSGLLSAYRARADGRRVVFGFYGAGKTLGELTLAGGNRSASVAVEENALCSFVTGATLRRCITEEPALALELIALVASRAIDATDRATEMALDDVYDRLVRLLRAGSVAEAGGRACMTYALTQEQIAARIGCGHPMVNKLLGGLRKGGYLCQEQRLQGRVWVIQKPLPARY